MIIRVKRSTIPFSKWKPAKRAPAWLKMFQPRLLRHSDFVKVVVEKLDGHDEVTVDNLYEAALLIAAIHEFDLYPKIVLYLEDKDRAYTIRTSSIGLVSTDMTVGIEYDNQTIYISAPTRAMPWLMYKLFFGKARKCAITSEYGRVYIDIFFARILDDKTFGKPSAFITFFNIEAEEPFWSVVNVAGFPVCTNIPKDKLSSIGYTDACLPVTPVSPATLTLYRQSGKIKTRPHPS